MSTEYLQETRLIAVETPLGQDVLLLTAFSGQEEISRPFRYQLEMLSARESIDPREIVGKRINVTLKLADGRVRYFNGFVSRFSAGSGEIRGMRQYRAEMVSWLWFLTRTADCRIFQNKTVPEILELVFADLGFAQFESTDIKGPHRRRDYCVQYRETDFNFVSRLMEQAGIFYWFRHEKGNHTLVLADQKGAYRNCPEDEVDYMAGSLAPSHISAWDHRYEFRSGKWAQKDYNFEDPTTNLMTSTPTLVPLAEAKKYEIYDYPGAYQTKEDGEPLSRLRMEEEEMRFHTVDAASTCRTFTAGGKFTLKRHTFAAETGKSYLITAIQPTARDDSYISRPSASPKEYANTFTCIPADAIFRPARITPKPVVAGPQTAVVVGPKGEEIWTDKYGRVKVQFHWDRYGQSDENSSCWVRVSHPWAGKKWGALATPRIGQEVIVDFLEGDPDQPIITGRVYNAVQMPPYDLNDQGGGATNTISGMKSASTPGSGGYNEMSMDDTKGKEKITIHGQYDMNTTVQHDKTTTVNNNRSTTVVVDDTLNVNSNRTVHVKGKLSETIDTGQEVTISSGYQETITGGATSTISGGLTSTVNGQWENTVSGHLRETVTAGEEQGVTGGKTLTVTGGFTEEVTGERWMTVTGPINQSATTTIDIHAIGAGTYTSDASLALAVAGSVVEITPDTITISAAGSTIKVDASGVSINGQKISLNC